MEVSVHFGHVSATLEGFHDLNDCDQLLLLIHSLKDMQVGANWNHSLVSKVDMSHTEFAIDVSNLAKFIVGYLSSGDRSLPILRELDDRLRRFRCGAFHRPEDGSSFCRLRLNSWCNLVLLWSKPPIGGRRSKWWSDQVAAADVDHSGLLRCGL